MLPDDPPSAGPIADVERRMREEPEPEAMSPLQREALLRRILKRIGGVSPLAPAPETSQPD